MVTSGETHTAHKNDTIRAVTVTIAMVVCIVGGVWGSGALGGTPVAEAAGGALSATATLLAPAGAAFSIWSVIYLGLIVFTIWHWMPAQRSSERHRRIGWLAVASMLLNTAWLACIQAGWLWLSVAVIAALVLVLGVMVARIADTAATSTADTVITAGTFGLYVGWSSVATCANIAAVLKDAGVDPEKGIAEAIGVAVLLVAGAVGGALLWRTANLATAVAVAWGLGWIGYGRLGDEPESTTVGIAAVAVAAVVLVAGLLRSRSAGR